MARYEYSTAVRLEAAERVRPVRHVQSRPDFEVVEGAGLDARARQGVSTDFLSRVKLVVMSAALVLGLGAVRVGLCSQTVSALQQTSNLRTEIKNAQALEDELKVEHSVMYSSVRIEKIATQTYGMVQATETATISLASEDAEALEGEGALESEGGEGAIENQDGLDASSTDTLENTQADPME